MSAPLGDAGLRRNDWLSEEGDGREEDSGNVTEESSPGPFYPLRELLRELVKQENDLWEKTHGVQFAAVSVPPSEVNEELLSVGGGLSTSTIPSLSSITTETRPLYFIRYGQLTNKIHQYFRKLEKEHACLYLSGRKAHFASLRLHPVDEQIALSVSEDEVHSASTYHLAHSHLHALKDEELLVYRCSLMCAHFPMLSAPSPPDDQSPSPPLPPEVTGNTSNQDSKLCPPAPASILGSSLVPVDASKSPNSAVPLTPNMLSSVASNPSHKNPSSPRLDEHPLPLTTSLGHLDSKQRPASFSRRLHPSNRWLSDDEDAEEDEDAEVSRLSQSQAVAVDPLGREQPFTPMVNREMMCSLVRRAFQQTEEQQLQSEQILRHEHGRRSKGEILARELVAQLHILDNNAHPFYKPKNFVTRNGYDIWLQAEKQRVREQLDKFWHYQHPKAQPWMHSNPTDYHKAYTILVHKVICSESRSTRREPVHGGRTPSAALSPTAQRLLKEFGLRYGVGELFRRVVYLDYLAKHFDYEVWYIRHCTLELKAIRSLIPHNRSRMTSTRREMDMLRNTVHLLHGQTDNSMTRIKRLFQSDPSPQQGVACLIELLKEVLDAEQVLFNKRMRPLDEWLKKYLKSGFVLQYEKRKEIISDEILTGRNAVPFVLTAVLVNALLLAIKEEVIEYRECYQGVFRNYFNISPFAKVEFYRLLCADACSLCARAVHNTSSRQKLNLELLGLLYRLNDRDVEWANVISIEMQQWRNQFVNLALNWMDVLGKQVNEWTLDSLKNDQWTLLMVNPNAPSACYPSSSHPDSRPSPSSHPSGARAMFGGHAHTVMQSSVRQSPFPSPLSHDHQPSAFTRIRQLSHGVRENLSPMSESSGGITDMSSVDSSIASTSMERELVPGRQILLMHDLDKGLEGGESSSDSMLNFGNIKQDNGRGASDTLVVGSVPGSNMGPSLVDPSHPVLELVASSEMARRTTSPTDSHLLHSPPCLSQGDEDSDSDSTPVLQTQLDKHPLESKGVSKAGAMQVNTTLSSWRRDGAQAPLPHHFCEEGPEGLTNPVLPGSSDPIPVLVEQHQLPNKPPQITVVQDYNTQPPDLFPHVPPSLTQMRGFRPEDWQNNSSPPIRPLAQHSSGPGSEHPLHHSPFLPSAVSPPIPTPISPATQNSHYFFPVSSSPIDIVTVFNRLAGFVGKLLYVLTPKVRQGVQPVGVNVTMNNPSEMPREVAQVRKLTSDTQMQAENMRIEFLKKLHKIMVKSLKLYADNVLCMDLCCWPNSEAKKLLGEERIHHLQRRKESGEIWGCRHVVEARHGLHPNGLPCQRKECAKFESITRDMCVRVNNIHALISIFPLLGSHIYTTTLSPSNHMPFGLCDYLSSGHESGPPLSMMQSRLPFPHRYRPEKSSSKHIKLLPPQTETNEHGGSSELSGVSMSPAARRRMDTGFKSIESQQLLDYLCKTQQAQLDLLCIRMNQFLQPALALLLDLRLRNCDIGRRLDPVTSFLQRHHSALKKYLYQQCFDTLMGMLWIQIVKNLEEETMLLRKWKKPSTARAHLLLQTLTHLIKVMHNKGKGIPLDTLTMTTEYLLALLEIFVQPTEKLIKAFKIVDAPQFTVPVNLEQAPVYVDPAIIHSLMHRLHAYRKCFTGSQFVEQMMELGKTVEEERLGDPPSEVTPSDLLQPYTEAYATQLGQFLLRKGILVCLMEDWEDIQNGGDDGKLDSQSSERLNAVNTSKHLTERDKGNGLSSSSSLLEQSTASTSSLTRDNFPRQFKNSHQCLYRFVDMEDSTNGPIFRRVQVLCATAKHAETPSTQTPNQGTKMSEFDQARYGTLFLILDVIQQRASKDRTARDFLRRLNIVRVVEQKREMSIPCSKIFRV